MHDLDLLSKLQPGNLIFFMYSENTNISMTALKIIIRLCQYLLSFLCYCAVCCGEVIYVTSDLTMQIHT